MTFFILFFLLLFLLFFFFMGNSESSQKQEPKPSSSIRQKSSLSKEEAEEILASLKNDASKGNVMACYDAGFMMIQGIGCWRDWKGGLQLIIQGSTLESDKKDESWKSDKSVTKRIGPQTMFLRGLFLWICDVFIV